MSAPELCQTDWQGPSDAECMDDLLVIACIRPFGHSMDRPHVGHLDKPTPVYWWTGTGDLHYMGGRVARRQFNRAES